MCRAQVPHLPFNPFAVTAPLRHGFTLIELLSVIAIIAMLAALLLPSLSKAAAGGRSAGCINNQRQLHMAWQMYADDNSDRLVPNWFDWGISDWKSSTGTANSWVRGSALTSSSTEGIRRGALYAYTRTVGVYRCPSDQSVWRYGDKLVPRPFNIILSLALNGGVNGQVGKDLDPVVATKLSQLQVKSLHRVFTFMDGMEGSMTMGGFVPNMESETRFFWYTMPGQRDLGCKANIAFVDGRVDSHKWKFLGRERIDTETPCVNALDREDLLWVFRGMPDP